MNQDLHPDSQIEARQECVQTGKQKPAESSYNCRGSESLQADEEIRTLDPLLGKEMLYH